KPQLRAYEEARNVQRGEPGSEVTAMCYGEYFPNPGAADHEGLYRKQRYERLAELVTPRTAFTAAFLGTLILALAVFALTDERHPGGPPKATAPPFIGLTVAIMISVIAPLTQAYFNPARD